MPSKKKPARVAEAAVPLESEKPVRKNFYLYQSKIDMAREVLGVKTETEAIERALDMLIYGERMARGTRAMYGEEYNDVFGIVDEIPEHLRGE